jgi:hypothetical protein
MQDIVIARIQLINVLDEVKSIIHDLTEEELDALMNKHACLSRRYNSVI